MSLKEIAEGFPVEGISLNDGKLVAIDFSNNSSQYHAIMFNDSIMLYGGENKTPLAELYFMKGKTFWFLNHCCGASGFGVGHNSINDICHACESPRLEENSENYSILMVDGRSYSKELSDLLTNEILAYKSRFEKAMK
jgi:hypothetical protein